MKQSDFLETICISGQGYTIYNIRQLEKSAKINISRLPFSIRILVENLLRKQDRGQATIKGE